MTLHTSTFGCLCRSLINTTLTCNASSTYTLPRKLCYCKLCGWHSLIVRNPNPNLEPIRQQDLPSTLNEYAVRVISISNKLLIIKSLCKCQNLTTYIDLNPLTILFFNSSIIFFDPFVFDKLCYIQ
jgi:hypothetical protein